ncbi:alpha/beta hydrolase family protein [Subtercola lobariae]|uniref:Alpha/beta hydrolase n=1 Tax=Subtercola lobariae TaxID=1588641 RepID=A0A917EUX7_9MICO|nr:alpha/beta hydrolase [Subtercola lobariae]GGF18076.1 alpha/beta hydrolase [Subtercola lobariae]
MARLMKDDLFEAQLVRALGYAPYGGADFGECAAIASRIHGTDLDAWHDQWSATAAKLHDRAQMSLAAGDRISARSAYFRASNYFRTAGLFTMGAPLDSRLVEAHAREVENFRAGAALLDIPPQIVEIPYENGSLPGYFFRAAQDAALRPTLILVNGYDGTAEELYFTNGAAALQRGYNVLAFDGPGQGAMLIDRGVVFRPDWEAVVTPVVNFALELAGVHPHRLVLMGLSFGGYLAPRAASVEHRLAACVSDCGPYDLFDASASRLPGVLAKQLPDGNPALLRLLGTVLAGVMKKPTAGWALRRNLMVHGLTDPLEYFRMAPEYSLKGREGLIACSTFVCSAEGDDLSVNAPRLFEALDCPKKYVQFMAADGAGAHCESGARTLFHQEVFAWLDSVLTDNAAQSVSA